MFVNDFFKIKFKIFLATIEVNGNGMLFFFLVASFAVKI